MNQLYDPSLFPVWEGINSEDYVIARIWWLAGRILIWSQNPRTGN